MFKVTCSASKFDDSFNGKFTVYINFITVLLLNMLETDRKNEIDDINIWKFHTWF